MRGCNGMRRLPRVREKPIVGLGNALFQAG